MRVSALTILGLVTEAKGSKKYGVVEQFAQDLPANTQKSQDLNLGHLLTTMLTFLSALGCTYFYFFSLNFDWKSSSSPVYTSKGSDLGMA